MINRQIKIGALISYIAYFINIVIGLFYTPWLITSIGKSDYGLYTLSMSMISLFIFDFGLSDTVTRYVAKYRAEGRKDLIEKFLALVYKIYFLVDLFILIVLIVVYFLIPVIYDGLTLEEQTKFKVIYVIAAIYSLVSLPFIPQNGIISANEKFIQLKSCDLLDKLLRVVLMSICLLLGYGLYALVLVNAVSGVVVLLIKNKIIRDSFHYKIAWGTDDRQLLRAILTFSVWITVIAISQRLMLNLAPTILGMYAGASDIAILGIAIILEGFVFTFASAFNGLFLPYVSNIVSKNDVSSIYPVMLKMGRLQIVMLGLIIGGYIVLGKEFIILWMGAEYVEVYSCTLFMILPLYIILPQSIAATAMVATNKVKYTAIVNLIKGATCISLAFPLSYKYGVFGMSCAVFIAYVVFIVCNWYIYQKALKINMRLFFVMSYCKMTLPIFFVVVLGIISNNLFFISANLCSFVTKGVIFTILYIVVMFRWALNGNERKYLTSVVSKILRKLQ